MTRAAAAVELLTAAGLEACWLWTGLGLLAPVLGPAAPAPALLLAGLPLAYGLGRSAAARPRRLGPAVFLSAGAAWLLLAVRVWGVPEGGAGMSGWIGAAAALARLEGGPNAAQLALGAGAVVWACGARLARGPAGPGRIFAEFQFGLIVLGFLFFCAGQWQVAVPWMQPVAALFFLLFFAGAAAARAAAGATRPRGSWLGLLAVYGLLVLGLGALVAAAATPERLQALLAALAGFWDLVAGWLARFFAWLARMLPQPEIAAAPMRAGTAGAVAEGTNLPELLRIPDALRRAAGWMVAGFWIALIGLSLWRIAAELAAWLRRRTAPGDGGRSTPLAGGFSQDLARWLRRLAERLRGVWPPLLRRLLRRRGAPAEPAAAAAVRRTYRRLLAWSARRGCVRRPHETPEEFLAALCRFRPAAADDFRRIAAHYIAVRYGEIEPGPQALQEVAAAWKRAKHAAAPKSRGGLDP
jgi:hypothetical protein